jgi:tetratricopeptide (TPR) repeat protein
MRTSPLLSMIVIAVGTSLLAADQDAVKRARAISKDAYEAIYQHPYETNILEIAAKHLNEAHTLNEKEPYVWLGAAELILAGGMRPGPFFHSSSYEPGTLARALPLAQRAIQLDSKLVDVHNETAKILLLLGHLTEAQNEIDIAQQLDPDGFRPWFYQAMYYWKQGSVVKCREALRHAGAAAKTPWQQGVLLSQLEQMAEARGDDTERERILKTLIAIDPKRPWPHGNYGWFLLERERYDEAIAEFEKAVTLGPYPNAEDGLERARRQRDALRGRH